MTTLKNLKMIADGLFNESNYKMALCAYEECIKYFESNNMKLDNKENMEVSFISILIYFFFHYLSITLKHDS